MDFKEQINLSKLPKHIAIVMDGNGRWAKEKGKLRVFGHKNGIISVKDVIEGATEIGIEYVTLYAFSTENWNRPKLEVAAIMEILISTIHKETQTLINNNVRLNVIGNMDALPTNCKRELNEAMQKTAHNYRLTLTLALSYSARWDITQATKNIAQKVKNGQLQPAEINETLFSHHLNTHNLPDPELLIRTSGEHRVSNYLLWEIAYAELYFTPKLWPDFRRNDLFEAIYNFQKRERRFGLTSEQLT
ncbi:MAG: isoprenyl transferase [Sphingobacteriales bacterium]|nr:MAG: isoprenyl transferase [Sphingobacteriales bacterium]TAF82696.1 MAG: isoprenyl transferase [Sphingobacteriales bacterium]